MADQGQWFKLWCSALNDADLENLTEKEWFCWVRLGAYIKAHGEAGTITFQAPGRVLCLLFHVPTFSDAITIVKRFPHCTLEEGKSTVSSETIAIVTCKVSYLNWYKYQGDYSTGRVRKWRQRKHQNETCRGEETRGEEKRREENPPNPPLASPKSKATSTLKINGKPAVPDPEIPESQRMSPDEMESIKRKHLGPKPAAAKENPIEADLVEDELVLTGDPDDIF